MTQLSEEGGMWSQKPKLSSSSRVNSDHLHDRTISWLDGPLFTYWFWGLPQASYPIEARAIFSWIKRPKPQFSIEGKNAWSYKVYLPLFRYIILEPRAESTAATLSFYSTYLNSCGMFPASNGNRPCIRISPTDRSILVPFWQNTGCSLHKQNRME